MAHKDDEFDKNGKRINWMPMNSNINFVDAWKDGRFPEITQEDILCEMQLMALGDIIPLSIELDLQEFAKEIKPWKDSWVPYLRREGVTNDREGLLLVGPESFKPNEGLSMPEIQQKTGRKWLESEMTSPTELYNALPSLHPILNIFDTLGRTMLVKANAGGWFPPHRDQQWLSRDVFRLVCMVSKTTDFESFEWENDFKTVPLRPGRCYYIDTRKVHRTHSWRDDSIHLIINVPKTWENVLKVMSITRDY